MSTIQRLFLLFALFAVSVKCATFVAMATAMNGNEENGMADYETINDYDFGVPLGFEVVQLTFRTLGSLTPGVNISIGFYGHPESIVPFSVGITSDMINLGPTEYTLNYGTNPLGRFGVIAIKPNADLVGSLEIVFLGYYNWRSSQPCTSPICCSPFYW